MVKEDGYIVGSYTGYIASGHPSILCPKDYYNSLLPRIIPPSTPMPLDANGFSLVPCILKDSAPKLKILLGDYWIEILPAHYLTIVSGDTCRLEINKNTYEEDKWVLG